MPGRIVVCAMLAAGVLWHTAESSLSAPVLNSLSAQPGSVDLSFDVGTGADDNINVITAARDGKLLIGGDFSTFNGAPLGRLARLNPGGTVDAAFHPGSGVASSGKPAGVASIVIQPNDKILIGGYFSSFDGIAREGVARLNSDGTLEGSFNPGTGIAGGGGSFVGSFVSSMAVQPDGKILIVGSFATVNGVLRSSVARLNSDGGVDMSFDPGSGSDVSTPVQYVLLQTDGRIIVSGNFTSFANQPRPFLVRLNTDGSVDESFNPPIGSSDYISGIALQPDGRILLGASYRLNPDGSADSSFSPPWSINGQVYQILLQDDGKIVESGNFTSWNGLPFGNIVRLNSDGTLDGNFDTGTGADGQVLRSALENDGGVIISGFVSFNGIPNKDLMRLYGGEPAPRAPAFRIQPIEQVLNDGKTVAFSVFVSAFPLPTYQWQRNGQIIAGATRSLLMLTNLSMSDAGTYQLRASNSLGSVLSAPSALTAPTILLQPLDQTVREGQGVSFSIVVTNFLPVSLQWQFEGTNIPGATTPTLVLNGVQLSQAGRYSAIASDSVGSVTSASATLTALPALPPSILAQPASQVAGVGQDVLFSVIATNYLPLSYQWQFNGTNINGATQPTLTLRNVQVSDGGNYSALVSSDLRSIMSATAQLIVKPVLVVPGPGVVTNADQVSLEAALNDHVTVTFGFNGTITLTNTLLITTNTTLDATGRSVSLDGNNGVRHFVVTNGATLRLINLNLINGRFAGALGDTNQSGNPGWGGSIYNAGGNLELIGCSFTNNQVFGGDGGPPVVMWPNVATGGPTAGAPAYGGAIYSIDGAVRATNCSFANNRVQGGQGQSGDSLNGTYTGPGGDCYGGAIFTTNSAVSLVSVRFSNNLAQAGEKSGGRPWDGGGRSFGGAVADASGTTTLVTNCVFVGNQALGAVNVAPGGSDEGSANAGALFHDGGNMSVSQTLFSSNSVTGGGGISRGLISITSANGNGGAVFNRAGNLELKSCALLFNKANGGAANDFAGQVGVNGIGSGGAVFNMAFLTLANCTVGENGAVVGLPGPNGTVVALPGGGALGGFLFNSGGSASLLNVTVADNYATSGASSSLATGASIYNTSGSVTLTNAILLCAPSQTNVSGTIIDGGHNLSSDASAKFTLPTSRNNTDPLLGPLADNGGPTPTRALLLGSPALDAGDNAVCPTTDQRGIPRPMGSGCDIGAFELAPKLSLTRGPQGNVRIDFIFEPGKTYAVKASTNLADWITLGTGTSDTNGWFEFKDTSGIQFPRRFYRVE